MIGDNPIADQQGAAAVGMNSIVVRHPDGDDIDLMAAVLRVSGRAGGELEG
jgi:FMN phosphatase YigB (HAD superfamily)